MRHRRLRTFGAQCVLAGSLCAACGAPPPAPPGKVTAVDAAAADADVTNYQLRALEARVQAMPEGTERDYFGGVLAVRSGRFDEGIPQLTRAAPSLRESAPARAALALEALATASLAISHYGDAAQAYDDLSAHFADHLDRFPADDAALAHVLSGTPPPTIAWREQPVRLKTAINPIGLRVAELMVNGAREQWLLDTGANQSLVTRSFADRLGLKPLPGVVPVGSGVTGFQSSMQVAVLPILTVGGATLQHVAVGILDDQHLRVGIGGNSYQIRAILGYPVFRALGAFTFTREGEFRAGDAERPTSGARMYM